ncbi:L,D-transpeptidase [Aurantimonas marianensis]|uniref:L,D-transpeptidase n=1 Tax=Aurantimonas marianensis TaxID=2920428 RepID=A0A9X2H890_9HYPH|nr:L,D-transpeptidase [Aurantimonas marianensis]MCP3055068.1 L,D-transpeptidase [Aurantimonas marianensis]
MPTKRSFDLSATLLRIGAIALATLTLAACSTSSQPTQQLAYAAPKPPVDPRVARMYGAVTDDGWQIPAVDPKNMDPRNIRQVVDYETKEPAGTIVVDPRARFLYLVMENGKAMRYGVGVGKAGLEFTGSGVIRRKAAWPHWTPTQDMIKREPDKYGGALRDGMDGGIDNPLGARALYLYKDGRDTLYRIHGTNQEWSIGKAVSSGCIRMLNQDVIDLNSRVPKDTRIVVI